MTLRDAKMQPTLTATPKLGLTKCVKWPHQLDVLHQCQLVTWKTTFVRKGSCHRSIWALWMAAQYPFSQTVCKRYEKFALQWESWRAVFTSQAELLRENTLDHSVGLYRSLHSERKPATDPTEGSLSGGKIDIVNNDTMTGRFDVISNVILNGARTAS